MKYLSYSNCQGGQDISDPRLHREVGDLASQNVLITLATAIASFCGAAIGLFLLTPLFTGMDITLAARYQFFYFPGIVMLMGVILASCWRLNDRIIVWISGKRSVAVILMMGAIGSCIVALDRGYCKPYAPADLVANMLIHESYTKNRSTPDPLLIATTHNSLIQVGELMSIAWEMQQVDSNQQRSSTHFLIAHQNQLNCVGNNCPATTTLRNAIDRLSTSINLWLVNFYAPVMLPSTCKLDRNFLSKTNGYNYSLYHCSEGVNV